MDSNEASQTSIEQLQNNNGTPPPVSEGQTSNTVVKEILDEIKQNDNNNTLQYNTDQDVQQPSFNQPQNEEEARRMQQEILQQEQMQMQMQNMQNTAQNQQNTNKQAVKSQSFTDRIMKSFRDPLIVAGIILLLLVLNSPLKQLLHKIPRALNEEGGTTLIGSAIIAILGGLLYAGVNMSTSR
jgi:Fe2+ transport system protein B